LGPSTEGIYIYVFLLYILELFHVQVCVLEDRKYLIYVSKCVILIAIKIMTICNVLLSIS